MYDNGTHPHSVGFWYAYVNVISGVRLVKGRPRIIAYKYTSHSSEHKKPPWFTRSLESSYEFYRFDNEISFKDPQINLVKVTWS